MTVSAYLVRTESGRVPPAWKEAVVVVDEAGLSSNRQGAALLKVAEIANQRVVLVGDSRQHSSVDAGDFMRVLEKHSAINTRVLQDIRRQTVTAYKQAVQLLADGQAAAGMEQIDKLGWLKEEGKRYLDQAAAKYLRLLGTTSATRKSAMCIAPTWHEIDMLTKHIRAGLSLGGKFGEIRTIAVLEPMDLTTQHRKVVSNYQKGQVVTFNRRVPGGFAKDKSLEIDRIEADRLVLKGGKKLNTQQAASYSVARWREIELAVGDKILLRANRKKFGLINGDVLTVAEFHPDGSIRTVEGKVIPADYRHFTHGYAVTSHKSRGCTTDHIVVAAERLDAKSAYVACSRGRKSCTVFTPTKESLYAGLPRSADREAALDVLHAQEPERHRKVARSNREGHSGAAHKATKETDQETQTHAKPIRSRPIPGIHAIAAILRTIADASRELAAGKYCLARSIRRRRVRDRAIDRHHRRRSRGPATVRVELVQAFRSGLDHLEQQRGDTGEWQPDRMGYTRPGECPERADARDRLGGEPAERREAQQSTPEVTATSDLPTDLHREANERADDPRKLRKGGRGR